MLLICEFKCLKNEYVLCYQKPVQDYSMFEVGFFKMILIETWVSWEWVLKELIMKISVGMSLRVCLVDELLIKDYWALALKFRALKTV